MFARYRADGDEDARDELVEMYLNLVKYLASRFRNRDEPTDDLVQGGTLGPTTARDRSPAEPAAEFTTHATRAHVRARRRAAPPL